MKQYLFPVLLLTCFLNCGEKQKNTSNGTSVISNDTIPQTRQSVSKKPVASYMIPIGNPRLEYKFGVNIYETEQTFKYLMRMQYEGMLVSDTLKVPNFGSWPIVEVKPGKEKLSCIIGFLDKKKEFKEYKMLSIKNDQLELTVLKRYGVGVYSKKEK